MKTIELVQATAPLAEYAQEMSKDSRFAQIESRF